MKFYFYPQQKHHWSLAIHFIHKGETFYNQLDIYIIKWLFEFIW